MCACSEPRTAPSWVQSDTRWQYDSSQCSRMGPPPPASSPLAAQLSPLPLLGPSCMEAASSLFNGMSRKGSIVSACLKYTASLNNPSPPHATPLPALKAAALLRFGGCSQFTFSNSDKLPARGCFSELLHCSLLSEGMTRRFIPWKDCVLLDLKKPRMVSTAR